MKRDTVNKTSSGKTRKARLQILHGEEKAPLTEIIAEQR